MTYFSTYKRKRYTTHLLPILLFVAVIAIFCLSANSISDSNSSRQKLLLENALSRSITQCYALEGTYPPNLDYLKDNYGLTYDPDHYYIDYQYIGSNLRPDVTIIEKD